MSSILEGKEIKSSNLKATLKDGVDGSGGHAMYHQTNNENTRNMIMFMFCVLEVVEEDTEEIIFHEDLSCSPFAMRPLYLVLGKEVLGNLGDIKHAIQERNELKELIVTTTTKTYNVKLSKTEMTMIDSKMRGLVTGLGGAYCLLCTVSSNTACGRSVVGDFPVNVEEHFLINRTMEETTADYQRLLQPDGSLNKSTYEDRKGVTQEPLVDDNSVFSVSPLHSLMRVFDFVKQLLYHLRSETFKWTHSQIILGRRSYQFLMAAEDDVLSSRVCSIKW